MSAEGFRMNVLQRSTVYIVFKCLWEMPPGDALRCSQMFVPFDCKDRKAWMLIMRGMSLGSGAAPKALFKDGMKSKLGDAVAYNECERERSKQNSSAKHSTR